MTNWLHIVASLALVAMATAAPMSPNEQPFVAVGDKAVAGTGTKIVAKRAEEMVFFGNQQNAPRVPSAKRSDMPYFSQESPALAGQPDLGSTVVAHEERPVEEDLIARAKAVQGTPREDKLAEAMEIAKDKVVQAETEKLQEASAAVTSSSIPGTEVAPVAVPSRAETDTEDKQLSLLSTTQPKETPMLSENPATGDEDVAEFLEELRKDSNENKPGDTASDNVVDVASNAVTKPEGNNDLSYYQTMYHILTNGYQQDPRANYYNTMTPYYFNNRRRRSSLRRRRNISSIRRRNNRRSGLRRIKRDLPSDWLSAYRDIDLPQGYSDDILEDSLLSDPEPSYNNEQLSRYIYANLLNKLVKSYDDDKDAEVGYEFPYEDLLRYGVDDSVPENEIPEFAVDEYEPEEVLYDPVYTELPEDDSYAPTFSSYRKRSGMDYRKRYFYPAYNEPETHWGAFIPEKRSYDDAIQRLQRLAFGLSDSWGPYYERDDRKK